MTGAFPHQLFAALIALAALAPPSGAADPEPWDVLSDTWVATDALGRRLPGRDECGPPKENRFAGIFYFLWLGQHGTGGPYDITKILAANPSNPPWGQAQAFHHWGESELGYYLSTDEYVIRRHCELLVDAMVDTLIFDVTNGFTYRTVYELLCTIYRRIRSEGGKTPQICFLLHSSAPAVAQKLYDEFYSKNLYPELWFRWQGKPLILASPAGQSPAVLDFFSFRESWAWSSSGWFGDGRDKWPWLDNYPQKYGWHEPGVPEEVSVCVAQHPTSNIGRSFHDGRQPDPGSFRTAEGLCFAEQCKKALEIDPQFLFITGWNEWVAQRFIAKGGERFLGRTLAAGDTYFVDQYSQEYSRDVEPMKGGHTDNYYYQMMGNIRRFKGVRAPEMPSPPKTIAIDGIFTEWADVKPEFRDAIGDTSHRNHAGWGSAGTYTNFTGRNDFIRLKVARDKDHLYFYAETRGEITPPDGSNWMMLFLDADGSPSTGWFGYDYRVNAPAPGSSTTVLARRTSGGGWTKVRDVPYRVSGNQLELRIPRSDIGLGGKEEFYFDFHWADNLSRAADIAEFFTEGDSAPDRRANYRFDARCPRSVGTTPDCNENGVPDDCDLLLGTSMDSNGTGIPDECEPVPFRRGDPNADGLLDLSDGIAVLGYLFLGIPPIFECMESADSNGSGSIDISDGIHILNFLFAGGAAPSQPFPGCGLGDGLGRLTCGSFHPCSSPQKMLAQVLAGRKR